MIRYLFALMYIAPFFSASIARASETPASAMLSCNLPHANFKYAYMDSAIALMQKPSNDVFLNTASNHMDVVKAQFYLWYVYRNAELSGQFFQRVDAARLVKNGDDAVNAILWLMSKDGKYFSSLKLKERNIIIFDLDEWKISYDKRSPARSLVLELYADSKHKGGFFDHSMRYDEFDVDLIMQKGMHSEASGKKLEALFYYTKVAEFGYTKGLVGASLLLPQLGGDACVSRAAYYTRLSGAIGSAGWLERTH